MQITNDDTGRTFTFASDAAYAAAHGWYSRTEKDDIVSFCLARGVALTQGKSSRLVDDWADIAMELWAQHNCAA